MKLLFIFLISAMTLSAQTPEWSRKYHTDTVNCLQFSKDGKKLLTGGADGYLILWDVKQANIIKKYPKLNSEILSVRFNSNDTWFIISTKDFNSYIFDESADTALISMRLSQVMTQNYITMTLNDVSTSVAYNSYDDRKIHILTSGTLTQSFEGAVGGGEAGRYGLYDFNLKKFERTSNSSYFDVIKISSDRKHHASVYHSAYYPIGSHSKNKLLENYYNFSSTISSLDTTIIHSLQFFSYATGYENDEFGKTRIVNLGFTGDSKYVLSLNIAGIVHIRNVSDAKIIDSLGTPITGITELSGDMNGKYYITAHSDSSLRIWKRGIHNIFKNVLLPSNITKTSVSTIIISPDSVHFATAHTDGTVSFWNIDDLVQFAKTDSVFTPSIVLQPKSKYVCRGSEVVFKTHAVSNFGEQILYQWRRNGIDITDDENYSGTQTSELKIKSAQYIQGGNYSAVIFIPKGDSIITSAANLSFPSIYTINSQSDSIVRVKNGEMLFLYVRLSDTAKFKFQWYHEGQPVTGEQNASYYAYQIWSAQAGKHGGRYILKYFNECDTIWSKPIIVEVKTSVSIEENPFKTTNLTAEPNPFKNSTTIHFSLPKSLKIKLAVTDILGREVAVLKDEFVEIGEQNVVFKNENLPDGMYYITLSGAGLLKTIPVQIIR